MAIVVASDGINTEGPGLSDAAAYARRKGVPLFFVGIGSDRPAPGLRLSDLEVEESVFVNDVVHFRFRLTANGFQGQKATVVLKRQIFRGRQCGQGRDRGPSGRDRGRRRPAAGSRDSLSADATGPISGFKIEIESRRS